MGNFYSRFVRSGILFMLRKGNPKSRFQSEEPPQAPDYTDDACWAALPDKGGTHRFEVCLHIVLLCERATLAKAILLKAILEASIGLPTGQQRQNG